MACPSDSEWAEFLHGTTDAQRSPLLAQHLESCTACIEKVDQLTQVSELELPHPADSSAAPEDDSTNRLKSIIQALHTSPPQVTPAVLSDASLHEATDTLGPGSVIQGYQIEGEIARGGMGVVFKAKQLGLDRFVALKFVLSGRLASPTAKARFQIEAKAAAGLHHPNIVPIYEIGEDRDLAFLSMKLIEGRNLEDSMASFRLPRPDDNVPTDQFRQRRLRVIELMISLANALHYSHQRLRLHRDIKPTNILIDNNHQPYLTDFGLAKVLDDESHLTQSLAVMGTPAYMSPEVATGHSAQSTTSADVYSLGAVFYELLTGQAPYDGESALAIVNQILQSDPPRPRLLNPLIDEDLETICLKCLSREPDDRYASAGELADDLHRARTNRTIQARPFSGHERFQRWCRRNPIVATLAASTAVLTLLLCAGVMVSSYKIQQKNTSLIQSNHRLLQQRAEESFNLNNDPEAIASLTQILREDPHHQPVATRLISALAQRAYAIPSPHSFTHKGTITHARFSPDGKQIATASQDRTVALWDTQSGSVIHPELLHDHHVRHIAFSPDGTSLASASLDGIVRLWNTKTGEPMGRSITHPMVQTPRGQLNLSVRHVSYSPDGETLLTASDERSARLWDLQTQTEVIPPLRHREAVIQAIFHPLGNHAATLSLEPSVAFWDLNTARRIDQHGLTAEPIAATFTSIGKHLVVADRSGMIHLIDGSTGALLLQLSSLPNDPKAELTCLALHPQNHEFRVGFSDGTLQIWEIKSAQLKRIQSHHAALSTLEYSRDSLQVVHGFEDGHFVIRSTLTDEILSRGFSSHRSVKQATFSPDSQRLLTGHDGPEANLWHLHHRKPLGLPLKHSDRVILGRWSTVEPLYLSVAQSEFNTQLTVWNAVNGARHAVTLEHCHLVWADFKKAGNGLYLLTRDGRWAAWDFTQDQLPQWQTFLPDRARPTAGQLDSLGTSVAVGFEVIDRQRGRMSQIGIWRTDTLEAIGKPIPHDNRIHSIKFSPHSPHLLTVTRQPRNLRTHQFPRIRVCDLNSNQVIAEYLLNTPILSVQFHPERKRVLVCTEGERSAEWDWETDHVAPLSPLESDRYSEYGPSGRSLTTLGGKLGVITSSPNGLTSINTNSLPIKIPVEVNIARFHPSERLFSVSSLGHKHRLFDTESGAPLSDWTDAIQPDRRLGRRNFPDEFPIDYLPTSQFSHNGRYILTQRGMDLLEIAPVFIAPLPVPMWFLNYAEARLIHGEYERYGPPASSPTNDFYSHFASWLEGTQPNAEIFPGAEINIQDWARSRWQSMDSRGLKRALQFSPSNPAILGFLLEVLIDEFLFGNRTDALPDAKFFAHLASSLHPNDEKLKQLSEEISSLENPIPSPIIPR